MYFSFPQVRSELCRVLGNKCVVGAEDRLTSALRVILTPNVGSEKMTNGEVIEAVKIIQQRTMKRKSSSLDVFKFQDVSILLLLL